ncbi:hypothetical protein [Amycolatopsis sp. GM8]|uniref:hypothetical protein n=1 Tax=Amycolatopsis sp. GM8 TaxID=2896530 RepID=UPI001F30ADFE|nr:hypothetical protein [Amycolatopsis sp. GM8]
MTEPSTLGRRAQNRLIRREFEEARAYGLKQRHARKLQYLADTAAHQDCQCEDESVHRHRCSYDDVISLLSASVRENP